MGYTNENIYQVYCHDNWWIKTVRDPKFDKIYKYEEMRTITKDKQFFSIFKLGPPSDNTFNILVKDKILPTSSPIFSSLYITKNDNNQFFDYTQSDNSLPDSWRLI